jgi:hypothetical protein
MLGEAFGAEGSQPFHGGGFMPSPGAQDGANTGPKKSYDSQSQSVRRLTVKQLSDGIKSSGAEGIMVDGKEISNVREVKNAYVQARYNRISVLCRLPWWVKCLM